jgi:hypothetical protein
MNQPNYLSTMEHCKVEIGGGDPAPGRSGVLGRVLIAADRLRLAKQPDQKGDVMNAEEKCQEPFSFLLLARSLASP